MNTTKKYIKIGNRDIKLDKNEYEVIKKDYNSNKKAILVVFDKKGIIYDSNTLVVQKEFIFDDEDSIVIIVNDNTIFTHSYYKGGVIINITNDKNTKINLNGESCYVIKRIKKKNLY